MPRSNDAVGDPQVTPETVRAHGLTDHEYAEIVRLLGRAPNLTELGVFSVMWSEHCSYKSSRKHLKQLPTEGPRVIHGPGENAGVMDIGDGLAVVFKIESHNHPSFIEPYQGAATGVGGILRDVFTMGARPIASLNSLRFGGVLHPKTPYLVNGVVGGIGGYGNCVGVPTVGGDIYFDECYGANILGERLHPGPGGAGPHLHRQGPGRRQPRGVRRLQDRPRRGPRRHHGLGVLLRGRRAAPPHGAGGRPLHREAPHRGVPGADADRRHRGHPGYGRRRPYQLGRGDGRARGLGRGAGAGARAVAREGHDPLRDPAVGVPGAHAAGGAPGVGGRGPGDLRALGPGRGGGGPGHRRARIPGAVGGPSGGRHPGGRPHRRRAAVRPAGPTAAAPGRDPAPGRGRIAPAREHDSRAGATAGFSEPGFQGVGSTASTTTMCAATRCWRRARTPR